MIRGLEDGTTSFDALRNLLSKVHGANSDQVSDINGTDFRVQSISDAVAISTKVTSAGLLQILKSLQGLALDLLLEGYFIRGAVVRAPLYHDDIMVFGDGLVRAFHYESEVAKFPRIVVTKEVREDILQYTARTVGQTNEYPTIDMLKQSTDGPMYLDVLQPAVALLLKKDHPFNKLTEAEQAMCRRYLEVRDKIQQRYGEAMDDPKHFEKVRWFATYWNSAIPAHLFLRIRDADRTF
jgi:hypothetical protein